MKTLEDNSIPLPYRQVSVQHAPCELNDAGLLTYYLGRECYKATRFVVLRRGETCGVIQLSSGEGGGLFRPIKECRLIAGPEDCLWIRDPSVDTGNRTAMARAAVKYGARTDQTLIVEGAFGHVNFYLRPRPQRLRVVDQIPPSPSRLMSLVEQVLAFSDFPPVIPEPSFVDIETLARAHPSEDYLVPCKVSDIQTPGRTYFLDEHPPQCDWLMLGCKRSDQIYQHFYGSPARRVETCPRFVAAGPKDLVLPTILRCCELEDSIEVGGQLAVVPWGANTSHVLNALKQILPTNGQ